MFAQSEIRKSPLMVLTRLSNILNLPRSVNYSWCKRTMSTIAPKEIKVPIPSGHIAGKIWNEGGIPVIGLHGWMDNAGTWDGIGPFLPKSLSLIAIDFPGHGFTPMMQTGGSTFLDLVLLIERVVQHFEIKEVRLLGHSMGAGAAFLYAATFPKKVKKIIMVDLIKPLSVEPGDQPQKTAQSISELILAEAKLGREPPRYDQSTLVDKMVKGYNMSLTEESAKILLKRGSIDHGNGEYSFSYDPRIKLRNILSMSFDQLKAFARQLECELLLIKASEGPFYEDKAIYEEMMSVYRESAKVFKYVTVEGTHHVHLNDPDGVLPMISEFLIDDMVDL
ncbi:probable serine hydrolase isoform X1 [Macrobrachium rosenbergii]|uniref:probable serine hydrolase isoform X1 n=2 Tax=Macrobrachium rosenbergii TaxID=79674 RepID=UPI0034D46E83